jgi:L-ascorbate metabolism protein UlaG (beta-lactamase superfamily)
VLLTHDHHADNLDTAGRALLDDVPTVITTEAGARRLGGDTIGLANWQSTRLEPGAGDGRETVEITATPCRHGPPLTRPIVGDVIGFALGGWPAVGEWVTWISGDTVLHKDLWEVADRLDIGVALVHLGGVRFPVTGPLRYTMTVDEAVQLCERLQAHTVIPVHYEGWSHFRQGRAAIDEGLASAPAEIKDAFRFLALGRPTDIAVRP